MKQSPYDILGVVQTATHDEIKRAYRRLVFQHHPDTGNGNPDGFRQIQEAYKLLSDPKKRAKYDQLIKALDDDVQQKQQRPQGNPAFNFPSSPSSYNVWGKYTVPNITVSITFRAITNSMCVFVPGDLVGIDSSGKIGPVQQGQSHIGIVTNVWHSGVGFGGPIEIEITIEFTQSSQIKVTHSMGP